MMILRQLHNQPFWGPNCPQLRTFDMSLQIFFPSSKKLTQYNDASNFQPIAQQGSLSPQLVSLPSVLSISLERVHCSYASLCQRLHGHGEGAVRTRRDPCKGQGTYWEGAWDFISASSISGVTAVVGLLVRLPTYNSISIMRMSQMSWTRGQTRLMAQAVAMSSIRDDVSETVDRAVMLWMLLQEVVLYCDNIVYP